MSEADTPTAGSASATATASLAGESDVAMQLDGFVTCAISHANAPGTNKVLATAARHWDTFVRRLPSRTMLVLPSFHGDLAAALHNEQSFMLFAAHLATTPSYKKRRQRQALQSRKAGTIESYVSTLRAFVSVSAGFPISAGMPRWKRFVKGLRRDLDGERAESLGLRAAHLRRVFRPPSLTSLPAMANQWAMLTTGWMGLMRPSEVCSLKRSDLSFVSEPPHAVIMLLPLKKAPGQAKVPIIFAPGDGSGADTYAALRNLIAVDPSPESEAASTPLFRYLDKPGKALAPPRVTFLVRCAAAHAGETRLSAFSGRSLRIGGATDLRDLKVSESTIMQLGRWSSDIYRIYARQSLDTLLQVSARMHGASGRSLEQAFPGYVATARM